ncbi:MAG: type II secretion system F family protein [Nanoarchaeota archaeon]|nr:type II secretion system F family protein [Nanoarchaeota archaeon]
MKKEILKDKIESKKTLQLKEEKKEKREKNILFSAIFSLAISITTYLITWSSISAIIALIVSICLVQFYLFTKELIKTSQRLRKMEDVFPDFIELMASNLRAGMTIDKALLLSSRKEFSPLDEEILNLGKDIITGKDINSALLAMASRIKSEKIFKTIAVINSGIRSGGNLAIILEETAGNMRQRSFIEKRAASNVLMYLIFIFFAVAVGAPALFALSSILIQVLTNILGNIPQLDTTVATNLPLTLTAINVPLNFVIIFSVVFLLAISTLASLLLGLVNKGEEKAGAKYILPLGLSSVAVYFLVRLILLSQFSDLLS